MNTILTTVLCGALVVTNTLLGPSARAQPAEAPAVERPERPQRPEGAGQRREYLAQLTESLGLTEAQVEQLRPILAAQHAELRALRRGASVDSDRAALRESMQAIREKYQGQIAAVLTEEQKVKWAKLRERGPRAAGPEASASPGAGSETPAAPAPAAP